MPRQLPWVNKGKQAKSKPLPKPIRRSKSDDDFFKGTVLERDEDVRQLRAPSSSPPPIEEFSPLGVGFMEDGSDKFDLRDDEWRMVEDEFLLTAKLFTQHLHLAEYERMKSAIEEKKSNIDRPTVPNTKPSFEARHRMRAEEQSKAQEEALQDVDYGFIGARASAKKPVSIGTSIKNAGAPPSASRVSEPSSDSDDLDAPRKQPKKNATPHDTISLKPTTAKPYPVGASHVKPPIPTPVKTNHVEELWGKTAATTPGRRVLSKEVAERLAKRKAEKEKEVKKKAKTDVEIPTFLF